jgi:PAS domain S-box-containing protein
VKHTGDGIMASFTSATRAVSIATGQQWRGEIRNRAKDGSHFWLDITIIPTTDSSGRVTRYTSVCVDITARKNAEDMLARL